jgi:RNA polymerase sigma-70 factor (ECF subfamily)
VSNFDLDADLAAARTGDDRAFRRLLEPHRRELQAHCYRMLGSPEEARDQVQETFLRAFRKLGTLEAKSGRASLRSWLYAIATRSCLDALEQRRPRQMVIGNFTASDPRAPLLPPVEQARWVEPFPDGWLGDEEPGPDARYSQRESIALALTAALQLLPPRQRATLLLRDVLGLAAVETAALLETTVAAVNSALQRARATLEQARAEEPEMPRSLHTDEERALLDRYLEAWHQADTGRLIALLREDAAFEMPPLPSWYLGADAIAAFLGAGLFRDARGRYKMIATGANGMPAAAAYERDDESGLFHPRGIHVLLVENGAIRRISAFLIPSLFPIFGLPDSI